MNEKMRTKTIATLLVLMFAISAFVMAMPVNAEESLYYFTQSYGTQPVSVIVTETETTVTWTIDFLGEAPYNEPTTEGNGQWCVGLVIALDGDGEAPAFQIHNNDGTDSSFDWGTWLVSPYDTTIEGNWNGWVSSFVNTPVDELDWVDCTGLKYNEVNPDGIFTITIAKSKLVRKTHWALNLAIGSGFWSTYLTYEQMACPVGEGFYGSPAFDWGNPIVDDTIPNYELAVLTYPPPPKPKRSLRTYWELELESYTYHAIPHKLLVMYLDDTLFDEYYEVQVLIVGDGDDLFSKAYGIFPHYDNICIYFPESLFTDTYSVFVYTELGNVSFLVASRKGIEISSR